MKGQDKAMARDLNGTDVNNTPNREFKTMIIRIFTGLEKRMEDIRGTLTIDITEFKNQR